MPHAPDLCGRAEYPNEKWEYKLWSDAEVAQVLLAYTEATGGARAHAAQAARASMRAWEFDPAAPTGFHRPPVHPKLALTRALMRWIFRRICGEPENRRRSAHNRARAARVRARAVTRVLARSWTW